MSGPTPTPWERFVYEHGASRIYRTRDGGGKELIADTYGDLGNANLMFAAPELLAACRKLLVLAEEDHEILLGSEAVWRRSEGGKMEPDMSTIDDIARAQLAEIDGVIAYARAAIAKAEARDAD